MNRIYKCLSIILVSILLYGCAGASDYNVELSGNYSLIRSSAHMVTVNEQFDEGMWHSPVIPEKITEIGWNNEYILAKQLGLKLRSPDDPDDKYQIPDESKVYYWILRVEDDSTFGPLSEAEFDKKKDELGIPKDLKLKKVSYKLAEKQEKTRYLNK